MASCQRKSKILPRVDATGSATVPVQTGAYGRLATSLAHMGARKGGRLSSAPLGRSDDKIKPATPCPPVGPWRSDTAVTCCAAFVSMPLWVSRSGGVAVRLCCHRRGLTCPSGVSRAAVCPIIPFSNNPWTTCGRLSSWWSRCYTAATWCRLLLITSV
jgi:hypothetical protein